MTSTTAPPKASPVVLQRLQVLADEKRLAIVETLRGGERCVCEIQDTLDVEQSLLSYHLRLLREAGLVRDRKEGRWVHYTLVEQALEEVEAYLSALRTGPPLRRSDGPAC